MEIEEMTIEVDSDVSKALPHPFHLERFDSSHSPQQWGTNTQLQLRQTLP